MSIGYTRFLTIFMGVDALAASPYTTSNTAGGLDNQPLRFSWAEYSLSILRAPPSALSQLNFGIDRLELAAGLVYFHLPIDAALSFVNII